MELIVILCGILLLGCLIFSIQFILVGQFTARKLRKNPKTKDHLGFAFMHGWEILNIIGALGRPKRITERMKKSWLPMSWVHGDDELIKKHTTRFDRRLSIITWYYSAAFYIFILIVMSLGYFGVFDGIMINI